MHISNNCLRTHTYTNTRRSRFLLQVIYKVRRVSSLTLSRVSYVFTVNHMNIQDKLLHLRESGACDSDCACSPDLRLESPVLYIVYQASKTDVSEMMSIGKYVDYWVNSKSCDFVNKCRPDWWNILEKSFFQNTAMLLSSSILLITKRLLL